TVRTPVKRIGGRLLLIDPDRRVLLIHEQNQFADRYWLTPGGGVEPGEDPRDAAVREASEEVGYDALLVADCTAVLVTRRTWTGFSGRLIDQTDHFYVSRVPATFEPVPRALTEPERLGLLGHRWWSVGELRASEETFLPPDLAEVIKKVIAAPP
ncbi:MAG: NUDIX hydrolase, partial [Trebonia sp.]